MSKSRNDTIWYPPLFMAILAFVMTLILAFLNFATKDTIELQQKSIFHQKLLYSMNIPFENAQQAETIFKENIEVAPINFMDTDDLSLEPNYYIYKENGEVKAYAFPIAGKALWGSVDAIVAIDSKLEKMVGMDIITHSETPGLGGRIEEDWFKEQFREKDLSAEDGKYFEYPPNKNANIDAITGATLTSASVKDLLNDNVAKIKENFKKGE